jgi:hypothetical protein
MIGNFLLETDTLKLEFRQKVGQNHCRELPKGRNFMCEKKENYPKAH